MKKTSESYIAKMKKNFTVVNVFLAIAMAILVFRLVSIALLDGEKYSQVTLSRIESNVTTLAARRGDILDRNNVLLATSTVVYNVILEPIFHKQNGYVNLNTTAEFLAECFDVDVEDVKTRIIERPNSYYHILLSNLTYSEVKYYLEHIDEAKGVIGVWLEENYKRNYTCDTLACSVLGFLEGGKGVYGIEKYYDSELTGIDGKEYTYVNTDNVLENFTREKVDGNTVKSTIDYNIQSIVEKYMMETLEESGAKTVAVTIQNPNTGEFYAMADTGLFDPNEPRNLTVRYSDAEIEAMSDAETSETLSENWKNFCVTDTYEPGSTFKVFTIAGALEEGCISQDEWFKCEGSREIFEYTIHCANLEGHGMINLTTAISESCNIALMDIAAAEGVETFCKYQSQFGFGSLTNIDLPNEMSCRSLIYQADVMSEIDLATNSFGQSFNVTMVQMSSAFSAIVNGGYYYKPTIVSSIYNTDGEEIQNNSKTLVSRPVSSETCDFLKKGMRYTVTEGTGTDAAVPGYITAGKTGTAEKGARGGDLWVASFIGFAPYENPEVVCYVVIDEPASGGEGSSAYACELFQKIMSEVLPYLNVTPASMDYDPTGVGSPEIEETDENAYDDQDYVEDDSLDDDYEADNYDEDYYDEDYYNEDNYEEDYYTEDDYDEYNEVDYYDDDYYYDDSWE